MVSRKQVVISAIHEYLGNVRWLQVIDWKPGTGAVVIERPSEEAAGEQEEGEARQDG